MSHETDHLIEVIRKLNKRVDALEKRLEKHVNSSPVWTPNSQKLQKRKPTVWQEDLPEIPEEERG